MRCDNTDFSKEMINIFNSKNIETIEGTVFLFDSLSLGNTKNELGKILIKKYLYKLSEFAIIPKTIILINEAVLFLTEQKNEERNYLKKLYERGTEILICEESINYLKISQEVLFGKLVSMETIIENQIVATKLIKL